MSQCCITISLTLSKTSMGRGRGFHLSQKQFLYSGGIWELLSNLLPPFISTQSVAGTAICSLKKVGQAFPA